MAEPLCKNCAESKSKHVRWHPVGVYKRYLDKAICPSQWEDIDVYEPGPVEDRCDHCGRTSSC